MENKDQNQEKNNGCIKTGLILSGIIAAVFALVWVLMHYLGM